MGGIQNGRGPHEQESFEASFKKLQEVVRLLSDGNLSLQESLAAFEEGMALSDRCAGMLEQAELRVKQVSERALRSAAGATASATPLDVGEPGETEVLSFEIEETFIFDNTPTKPTVLDELEGLPETKPRRGGAGDLPRRGPVDPLFDELDPLFDENE